MQRSKICLCLTCPTIKEDLEVVEKYRNWIDMVELRVDFLTKDERLHIRKFPNLAKIPTILTIRRKTDGGVFIEGEASRTTLFARGLAYADQDIRKNFAFIDLEEDFQVPSLQDAAFAFGTKVIRSFHDMKGPVYNLGDRLASMCITGYEIPKIACLPQNLSDVTRMFKETENIDFEHIVCGMGDFGLSTRILACKMNSFLTYVSPTETIENMATIGHIDPITINEVYNFKAIDKSTTLYGITGYPLKATSSPAIHNGGYRKFGINAVYIPIKSETVEEAVTFAEQLDMKGLSVTVPHKEGILRELDSISTEVGEIGACNTILKTPKGWVGYNTDARGLKQALLEFLGCTKLGRRKVAIIGAGGAAKAAAYVIHELRGRCCIFNRTVSKARDLADRYNFKYASLGIESQEILEEYSDIIIQTTSIGMGSSGPYNEKDDPLSFYTFRGEEFVYDIIYYPEKTPMLERAESVGCNVCNGYSMLKYQAYEQFSLFTGVKYE